MNNGPIQKLLLTPEYEDIEDIVVVESKFIELDKSGYGLRMVSLALTPDTLILGRYQSINCRDDPKLIYDVDRDLAVEGLEIKWLSHLDYVFISEVPNEKILQVIPRHNNARHFELCSSEYDQDTWVKWQIRLDYILDDPYGYIRKKYLRGGDIEEKEKVVSESDSDDSSSGIFKAIFKFKKMKKKDKVKLEKTETGQKEMIPNENSKTKPKKKESKKEMKKGDNKKKQNVQEIQIMVDGKLEKILVYKENEEKLLENIDENEISGSDKKNEKFRNNDISVVGMNVQNPQIEEIGVPVNAMDSGYKMYEKNEKSRKDNKNQKKKKFWKSSK